MVAPAHNFDPKIRIAGRISEATMGGAKGPHISCMWSSGVKKAFDVGGPSWIDFIYLWGPNEKQRSCEGGGGAQRPVWGGNELKKTGARSARVRTRGQNPLVTKENQIYLIIDTLHKVFFGVYCLCFLLFTLFV
jgi:hypothetical protein